MNRRPGSWLAWGLFSLFVVLGLTGSVLQQLNGPGDRDYYLLLGFMIFAAFGAFIASRVPRNPLGWLFLAVAGLATIGHFSGEYAEYAVATNPGSLPAPQWVGWFYQFTWIPMVGLMGTFIFLLFPDGRLPSRRWRPVAWYAGAVLAAAFVLVAFEEGPIEEHLPIDNPLGFLPRGIGTAAEDVGTVFLVTAVILSVASLFFRYRRAEHEQRQQLKWFLYAGAFMVLGFTLGDLLPEDFGNVTFTIVLLGLPTATAVAVLKYRLYDIDVVINKTVVYGALAAFVTLVYVGIVVGIGALVGSRGNVFLTILATAIIALAFQPARAWARHLANRLVYGRRATPYEVLSRLAHGIGSQYSADEAAPALARIVGEGTGAAVSEVWLLVAGELRPAASWPKPAEPLPRTPIDVDGRELPPIPGIDRAVPVEHHGELLGALAISMPRGEALTGTTEKLIEDAASQAGLMLRNVRLIEELRASRQRLVSVQDEERRRLERNIHDGAQQQLVALAVKLRLVEAMAEKDPVKAKGLAAEAKVESQEALENLRDLARGIYPPLLADKGLAAALEAQARKVPFPVQVEPNGIGRYSAETEATAYFCVLEALQNAAKYAEASSATIQLAQADDVLAFTVTDDGRGFDPATAPRGSGLQNLADRVEALGGTVEILSRPGQGTTVSGRIPVVSA
jgi:signal transduction histidine kinase